MKHAALFFIVSLLTSTCFLKQEIDYTAVSNAGGGGDGMAAGAGGSGGTVTPPPGGSGGSDGYGGSAGQGGMAGSGGGAGGTAGRAGPDDAGPGDAPAGEPASCVQTRTKASTILSNNCAVCHQAPVRVPVTTSFNFILEVERLGEYSGVGVPFVTPGNLATSRVFQRLMGNEMPPANIQPRPSTADVDVIRDWITNCARNTTGWKKDLPPDPSQGLADCQTNNTCANNGCCVFGKCRDNGKTCGSVNVGDGIPGMCTNGACINAGSSCGGAGQGCCLAMPQAICTSARTRCTSTNCVACGGMNEACCAYPPESCSAGMTCTGGGGGGNPGSCQLCGGTGQVCCGMGVVGQRTCNAGLTCALAPGMRNPICGP